MAYWEASEPEKEIRKPPSSHGSSIPATLSVQKQPSLPPCNHPNCYYFLRTSIIRGEMWPLLDARGEDRRERGLVDVILRPIVVRRHQASPPPRQGGGRGLGISKREGFVDAPGQLRSLSLVAISMYPTRVQETSPPAIKGQSYPTLPAVEGRSPLLGWFLCSFCRLDKVQQARILETLPLSLYLLPLFDGL